MGRIVAMIVLVLAALGAAAWYLLLRPGVQVASTVDPDVAITCSASASVSEKACRSWGDGVLSEGAPSHTFEMDDVAHLSLERGPFGGPCQVSYFLERYANDPAWTDAVACPSE
jgi:hypothetical protein